MIRPVGEAVGEEWVLFGALGAFLVGHVLPLNNCTNLKPNRNPYRPCWLVNFIRGIFVLFEHVIIFENY